MFAKEAIHIFSILFKIDIIHYYLICFIFYSN